MKVALAQIECRLGDIEANCATIARFARDASEAGCSLAIFPEMSDTGYEMHTITQAASLWPEGSFALVREVARQNRIGIIAGLAERTEAGVYNTLAAFDDRGQLLAKYRKIHLFSGSPVFEHQHLLAGNEIVTFQFQGVTIGLMTCYDLRFPELARALALRGAEVIAMAAAWPEARIEHWKVLTRARAIENQLYVCAANRTGTDSELRFGENSQIIDPTGATIAAPAGQSKLCEDIDLSLVAHTRHNMPVFKERQAQCYFAQGMQY
jgi:predicted amidohydrolase